MTTAAPAPIRLGFVGLGHMGTPIACALLEAGFAVTVWGRNPHKLEPAMKRGARAAASAAEVAADSDAVFLCVTDTTAVRTIVFGADGLARSLARGCVLVDHSTIDPGETRHMAAELAASSGAEWVDAPVSGGPPAVARKTLVVMAGGTDAAVARVTPVILRYAGRMTHMGPAGAGQATKLVNQALCGAGFMLLAETLSFARRAGVDAAKVPEALAGGRAGSALLAEYWPRMAKADFTVGGRIDIMLKDLDMVAAAAKTAGAAMPLTRLALELHRLLVAQGHGGEDNAAVVKLYD
ncbi:MAG: NAD(P)-dependent oxidoreductase [Hyphomicrobiaceae bacterium]